MLRQFLGLCPQPSSNWSKPGLHLEQKPGDLFLLIIASIGCSFNMLESGKSYDTKIKIVKSPYKIWLLYRPGCTGQVLLPEGGKFSCLFSVSWYLKWLEKSRYTGFCVWWRILAPPKEDAQNMAKTAFSRLRIAYFFKMCNGNNPNEKIEIIIDYI